MVQRVVLGLVQGVVLAVVLWMVFRIVLGVVMVVVLGTVLQVLLQLVKRFGTRVGNGSSSGGCTGVDTRGGRGDFPPPPWDRARIISIKKVKKLYFFWNKISNKKYKILRSNYRIL